MYRFTPIPWTECGFHLLPWKSWVLNELTTFPNSAIWALTCTLSPPVSVVRLGSLAPRRGARLGRHKSLILRMLLGSQNGSLRRAFPYPSSWTKVETFPVKLTRSIRTTDPQQGFASNSEEGSTTASQQ